MKKRIASSRFKTHSVFSAAVLLATMLTTACFQGMRPMESEASKTAQATTQDPSPSDPSSSSGENSTPGSNADPGTIPTECSSGTTICVGSNQSVKTLSAAVSLAVSGSVIELLPGTYKETVGVKAPGVTIRSAVKQKAILDCTGIQPYGRKACILAIADNLTVIGLVVKGAKGGETNEACFRNEPGKSVTIRHVDCSNSYNGILSTGGTWIVEDSVFHDNGYGDGQTHNFYFGGDCSLEMRRVVTKNSNGGHALKSRCPKVLVEDSELHDNTVANAADFSNGGDVTIRGTLITQPAGDNGFLVRHGAEGCTRQGQLSFENVTFKNSRSPGYIRSYCGSILFSNSPVPSNIQVTMAP